MQIHHQFLIVFNTIPQYIGVSRQEPVRNRATDTMNPLVLDWPTQTYVIQIHFFQYNHFIREYNWLIILFKINRKTIYYCTNKSIMIVVI